MTVSGAIKEIVHQAKLTQKSLAEKAGYKTVSSVSTPIAKDDLMVSTLLKLADAAGFDLYLVKRANVEGYNPIRIDPKPSPEKAGE